jgi:16S rRNA (guanine966-N2)-methyltransferase
MRVIAGEYRSRLLTSPRGMATRPTSDRLRETLFNVLGTQVAGAAFADLYAGSGAAGIEALSRGAARVVFVENAAPAVAAIRANLAALGIEAGATIDARRVTTWLRAAEGAFRFVFLDPPYELASEYATALQLLGGEAHRLLDEQPVVIAEHRRKQPLAEAYGLLRRYRVLEQGDAALSFFSLDAIGAEP